MRLSVRYLVFTCLGSMVFQPPLISAEPFRSTVATERVADWMDRQIAISAAVAECEPLKLVKVVFVGDSITDYWQMGDNPWHPGKRGGASIWSESFGQPESRNYALNVGITGDRTENVLHRITPKTEGGLGHLGDACLSPEFIVVMVGINNRWAGEEPLSASIYSGVLAVVQQIHLVKPEAIIVLQSILPYHETDINRDVIEPVNQQLAGFVQSQQHHSVIHYLDLYKDFHKTDGSIRHELFYDGLHPNEAGYRVWRDALVPFLDEVRKQLNAPEEGPLLPTGLGS